MSVNVIPKLWTTQQIMLSVQHARLESQLSELLLFYGPKFSPSKHFEVVYESLCRRLLWGVKIHQRLEERWLTQHGCLSPAHRDDHQIIFRTAFISCCKTANDPEDRLTWLNNLREGLSRHMLVSDAYDYSIAKSKS